jgi:hypothetical protein
MCVGVSKQHVCALLEINPPMTGPTVAYPQTAEPLYPAVPPENNGYQAYNTDGAVIYPPNVGYQMAPPMGMPHFILDNICIEGKVGRVSVCSSSSLLNVESSV